MKSSYFLVKFKRLKELRYLIISLVRRDMQSRYIGSFLGLFWSIIHPLMQLVIYYFVFGIIFKMKLGLEYNNADFTIWLTSGLLPWLFFVEIVSRSPSAVLEYSNVIKKSLFPSHVISIAHVVSASINHFIFMGLLFLLIYIKGYLFTWSMLGIIPYILIIILLGLGLSWIISSINVYFRDVGQFISVIINFWFYGTPVIYSIESVPEKFKDILLLNPMLYVVEGYRSSILNLSNTFFITSCMIIIISFLIAIIGYIIFKRLKRGFGDML